MKSKLLLQKMLAKPLAWTLGLGLVVALAFQNCGKFQIASALFSGSNDNSNASAQGPGSDVVGPSISDRGVPLSLGSNLGRPASIPLTEVSALSDLRLESNVSGLDFLSALNRVPVGVRFAGTLRSGPGNEAAASPISSVEVRVVANNTNLIFSKLINFSPAKTDGAFLVEGPLVDPATGPRVAAGQLVVVTVTAVAASAPDKQVIATREFRIGSSTPASLGLPTASGGLQIASRSQIECQDANGNPRIALTFNYSDGTSGFGTNENTHFCTCATIRSGETPVPFNCSREQAAMAGFPVVNGIVNTDPTAAANYRRPENLTCEWITPQAATPTQAAIVNPASAEIRRQVLLRPYCPNAYPTEAQIRTTCLARHTADNAAKDSCIVETTKLVARNRFPNAGDVTSSARQAGIADPTDGCSVLAPRVYDFVTPPANANRAECRPLTPTEYGVLQQPANAAKLQAYQAAMESKCRLAGESAGVTMRAIPTNLPGTYACVLASTVTSISNGNTFAPVTSSSGGTVNANLCPAATIQNAIDFQSCLAAAQTAFQSNSVSTVESTRASAVSTREAAIRACEAALYGARCGTLPEGFTATQVQDAASQACRDMNSGMTSSLGYDPDTGLDFAPCPSGSITEIRETRVGACIDLRPLVCRDSRGVTTASSRSICVARGPLSGPTVVVRRPFCRTTITDDGGSTTGGTTGSTVVPVCTSTELQSINVAGEAARSAAAALPASTPGSAAEYLQQCTNYSRVCPEFRTGSGPFYLPGTTVDCSMGATQALHDALSENCTNLHKNFLDQIENGVKQAEAQARNCRLN